MSKIFTLLATVAVLGGAVAASPLRAGSATLPAGRVDPCSGAANWAKRTARPAGYASLEGFASAERACAATFTRLSDACPHALKAGDAYQALATRELQDNSPKLTTTTDFALAFEAYMFATGACRGTALTEATRGAAAAARGVQHRG
ncbi:MAG TPA: hypothetical protein VK665_15340 [Candidatus Elarobacter sp.]|nr:hypothetical protein [Candidatus Elarobacter sp.]